MSPGENSAAKKSGENFPRRSFGGTVPSFATAAEGLCFRSRAKRLGTRLSRPFLAQMYEIWCCRSGDWRCWPSSLWRCVAILESLSGACLVLLQSFGRMALGALGISWVAEFSPGEMIPSFLRQSVPTLRLAPSLPWCSPPPPWPRWDLPGVESPGSPACTGRLPVAADNGFPWGWHTPHAGAFCADWCYDFPVLSSLTPFLDPSTPIALRLTPRGRGGSPAFPVYMSSLVHS